MMLIYKRSNRINIKKMLTNNPQLNIYINRVIIIEGYQPVLVVSNIYFQPV